MRFSSEFKQKLKGQLVNAWSSGHGFRRCVANRCRFGRAPANRTVAAAFSPPSFGFMLSSRSERLSASRGASSSFCFAASGPAFSRALKHQFLWAFSNPSTRFPAFDCARLSPPPASRVPKRPSTLIPSACPATPARSEIRFGTQCLSTQRSTRPACTQSLNCTSCHNWMSAASLTQLA